MLSLLLLLEGAPLGLLRVESGRIPVFVSDNRDGEIDNCERELGDVAMEADVDMDGEDAVIVGVVVVIERGGGGEGGEEELMGFLFGVASANAPRLIEVANEEGSEEESVLDVSCLS